MTSTAGIVGSASKGIGFLSGDAEYVRKRNLKNQQDRASRGGIMEGFIDGGESVVSGFASGISGLVTKPYEEVMSAVARCYLVCCAVLCCAVLFCTILFCSHEFFFNNLQAKKSGVQGFFRGVGLGIMGAALKPVMGVTDGLTSVVR